MSLIRAKSLNYESSDFNTHLYADYDPLTNTVILDCNQGLIWYLDTETTQKITKGFNVKIINTYKNMNKPLKLIYCNCNYFGNKIFISDKNNNPVYGEQDLFKFPLFLNGVPSINNDTNKYIEQSFQIDCINENNICITSIKNAY